MESNKSFFVLRTHTSSASVRNLSVFPLVKDRGSTSRLPVAIAMVEFAAEAAVFADSIRVAA